MSNARAYLSGVAYGAILKGSLMALFVNINLRINTLVYLNEEKKGL